MIKQEVVDEILARTDIETLVGGYVKLKRSGSNLSGLCPFHSEKSPSFTVYPASSSFYCFGCGIGGNAITFIRQMEHLDYPDAIELLAQRAGVTVLRDERTPQPSRQQPVYDKERLLRMNADAARYFHACLMADTPKAREALAYFTETRGLSMSTIRHFGLGYAPDSFDAFSTHMVKLGYTMDELVVGFLCGRSERGKYYDAFRNRVMFPILDVAGKVIAFGGRVMDKETKPKYKNTSDTPVFKKSRNLFALNFARHTCAQTMILCEGYMDVIAMHAAGFTNAVATLGTAITPEQARLMSRYTKRVIISYDADEPGQKAALRALQLLTEVGLDVRILRVPDAKDPDEYIKTYGKDKFAQVLSDAKSRFDYQLESLLSRYDLHLNQDKVKALNEAEKLISTTYSAAERDIYIGIVAERFGVEVKSVRTDVERQLLRAQRSYRKEEGERVRRQTAGYGDRVNPDYAKAPSVAKNEETVLGLLLLYPEHRRTVFQEGLLTEDCFYTSLGKRIYRYVEEAYRNGDSFPDMNGSFTPEEVGRITRLKLARMSLTENGDAILRDAVSGLRAALEKKQAATTTTPEALASLIAGMRREDT